MSRFIIEGDLWSNVQRSGNSIHETPYYGSYQPSLPEFFIEKYTEPQQRVLDPFGGRGTTGVQAALMGRRGYSSDINPYAATLQYGKHFISEFTDHAYDFLEKKLRKAAQQIELGDVDHLLPFFHPDTLKEILYLTLNPSWCDVLSQWVARMGAMAILTGHSDGHLSVKTMPPNTQVTSGAQRKLNKKHNLQPEYKEVGPRVLAKLCRLVRDVDEDQANQLRFNFIPAGKFAAHEDWTLRADMVLFSPPFLDVIDYEKINWIRCEILRELVFWREVEQTVLSDVRSWGRWMRSTLRGLCDRVNPGAHICVEAGVVKGDVNLIEHVQRVVKNLPLKPVQLYRNHSESHTRTAKTWGVEKEQGTNVQQVLVLRYVP